MIAAALNTPPRSLEQYADELRAELDQCRSVLREAEFSHGALAIVAERMHQKADRLLAVEREINWRMGL